MGIRGLTTFINNRFNDFHINYELHDSNLVIDGNSIGSQLYVWHSKCNDCFGGDYDRFGNLVRSFFKMLEECNVTPYVILDGGYETRKLATILDRMKNRIRSAKYLNSATEGSISLFPLLLRETFVDVALQLNVKIIRVDFEGDTETACLAKTLNCPVLSYDSDYYIFDVQYLPFSKFTLEVRAKRDKVTKTSYKYIPCELYSVDKFLDSFGGMDKNNLPILAVLLGNDYVKKRVFASFYQHIKVQKTKSPMNEQQRQIKSIITWLKNETLDSAIRKVLGRYKTEKRKAIAFKIQNALKGYNLTKSSLLDYFDLKEFDGQMEEKTIPNIELDNIPSPEQSELIDEESESSEEVNNSDLEPEDNLELKSNSLPQFFIDKYRKCLYPASFMDIISLNRYYCIQQVENFNLENSHAFSIPIISAIQKILKGPNKPCIYITRNEHGHVQKYPLPEFEKPLPNLEQIQTMSKESRKKLFLDILEIEEEFVTSCLSSFPESWHIYLIALYFYNSHLNIDMYIFNSLIMCALILNQVDKKIGYYRSLSSFFRKYDNDIKKFSSSPPEPKPLVSSILESFEAISFKDSLLCMKNLIGYFQMDSKTRSNSRFFDSTLIHKLAQLQSCVLHIKYLNFLLNLPFENFSFADFYNGTFIYNLSTNLRSRTNPDAYMSILLKECPSLLHSFEIVKSLLTKYINCNKDSQEPSRKRRKKKKEVVAENFPQDTEDISEDESMFDANNPFSILSSLNK